MDFETYQRESKGTAIYPTFGVKIKGKWVPIKWGYPVLGIAGEGGEIFEKVKKLVRDKNAKFNNQTERDAFRVTLGNELGDLLWYISQVATEFNLNLDAIAEGNISKLYSRLERGKVKGDGDNR